jgi:quercetin dioxygenase-like cupin family protein
MRWLMLCAVFAAAACSSRPVVVAHDGRWPVEALVRRHPLAADANIRAEEIDRTPAASVHLVQVRGGETPHRHAVHDLAITVLRGRGVLTMDGAARTMRAGDVAVIPRGAPHHFVNGGREPAVALVVFAPPLDVPDNVPVADVDSPAVAR